MQDSAVIDVLPDKHPQLRDYLFALIADPHIRVYAVMDGAFFKNIAAKLRDAGLARRALYRYDGDYSVVMGGPWLIDPYRQNNSSPEMGNESGEQSVLELASRFEAILQLAADTSGLVFWCGDASLTENTLYDHLRRLNQIEVPKNYSENHESGSTGGYELVTFRHADANVMAQVLPALDASQQSRLLGSCNQIFCKPEPGWSKRAMRMVRPDNLAEPTSGPLRWTPQTMQNIHAYRMTISRQKVGAYLREVDPGNTEHFSDEQLFNVVLNYEKSGNALGLESERAHMKWAYLMSITNAGAAEGAVAKGYFQSSSKHPDDAIDDILDELDNMAGAHWNEFWPGSQ